MPHHMADGDKPTPSRNHKPPHSKRSTERRPQRPATKKHMVGRAAEKDKSMGDGTQGVITENEDRALVAQKAHEIFTQRCAITEVEDWVQAERIVKEELLAQGQTAGFV